MTVRDALIANHHYAGHGSEPAVRRRNALLRYARARGVHVRALADLLDIPVTTVFNWSGGRIHRGDATLGDQAPNELVPLAGPAPIPGQETLV